MDQLDLSEVVAAFDAIAEAAAKLSAAFSSADGEGASAAVNGKPAKAGVRSGPAAKVAKGGKAKAAAADDEIDIDTVREKLRELAATKGQDALIEAFATVGASSLQEVDESQYQELLDTAQAAIDAEAEEAEEEPAKPAAKGKAKGKAKGPTLEDVQAAATALIEADKPAYLKLAKKLGKPSDMDEADYPKAVAAYEAAMREDEIPL